MMIAATTPNGDAELPSKDALSRLYSAVARLPVGLGFIGRHLLPRRPWETDWRPTAAELKDLALDFSDLPSIRAGLIASDSTRRQR
jgi:hypothetical protein